MTSYIIIIANNDESVLWGFSEFTTIFSRLFFYDCLFEASADDEMAADTISQRYCRGNAITAE